MAKAKRPTVPLAPDANERLGALQEALRREGMPRETTRGDIVSAMIFYTTPPQAAGMTASFLRRLSSKAEERLADGE